ncbi:MAG: tyrosine-type recombinase/integrase [Methylocystaceae bacterium]|nr:tyrosine-type recombinase/integrase [Methylocystaceae bacterium]
MDDLRFHDLRHEGISRLFEKGSSVPEVALVSGHRDFRMLARYTHIKAENIKF